RRRDRGPRPRPRPPAGHRPGRALRALLALRAGPPPGPGRRRPRPGDRLGHSGRPRRQRVCLERRRRRRILRGAPARAAAGLSSAPVWRHVNPIFEVTDLDHAVAWYCDVLGLMKRWTWGDTIAGVGSGSLELYLEQVKSPSPSRISVFVDNADSVCEQYRAAGAV